MRDFCGSLTSCRRMTHNLTSAGMCVCVCVCVRVCALHRILRHPCRRKDAHCGTSHPIPHYKQCSHTSTTDIHMLGTKNCECLALQCTTRHFSVFAAQCRDVMLPDGVVWRDQAVTNSSHFAARANCSLSSMRAPTSSRSSMLSVRQHSSR